MKKRSTLMAVMLALFTVIFGLNSVHAQSNDGKVTINEKIGWREYYGEPTNRFEKFDSFKYVGDVARNSHGIFYFTESGDVAWYNPDTGNTIAAINKMSGPGPRIEGRVLESGDIHYAYFVAGQNYLKGYTTLDKIKAAMNKTKGTVPAAPVVPKELPKNPVAPTEPSKPAVTVVPAQTSSSTVAQPAPKQGWVQDKGHWFYYDQQGRQKSGWVQVGGAWYYLASDGKMQTGWVSQGGVWYYLNGSGAMQTGWVSQGGVWYYLNGSGAMQTGWLNQGGTWYYLNGSGAMRTGWLSLSGTWYYLTSSGAMKTGWYQVNTKWYYSYSSGALAVNTTVDGYNVNANGEWV